MVIIRTGVMSLMHIISVVWSTAVNKAFRVMIGGNCYNPLRNHICGSSGCHSNGSRSNGNCCWTVENGSAGPKNGSGHKRTMGWNPGSFIAPATLGPYLRLDLGRVVNCRGAFQRNGGGKGNHLQDEKQCSLKNEFLKKI